MTNVKRLQKTLDRVMTELHAWGQGHWGAVDYRKMRGFDSDASWAKAPTCGTSFCLAGHATIAAGHTPLLGRGTSVIERVALKGKLKATLRGEQNAVPVADAALAWLDLDGYKGDLLFEAINTLADLFAYAFIFTAGEIEIPDFHEEFEDADGNFYRRVDNFPEEVLERVREIRNEQYPYAAFEALLDNDGVIMKKLGAQVERADKADDLRRLSRILRGE